MWVWHSHSQGDFVMRHIYVFLLGGGLAFAYLARAMAPPPAPPGLIPTRFRSARPSPSDGESTAPIASSLAWSVSSPRSPAQQTPCPPQPAPTCRWGG